MGWGHGDYRRWNVNDDVSLRRVLGVYSPSREPAVYRGGYVLACPGRGRGQAVLAVCVAGVEVVIAAAPVQSVREALVHVVIQLFESLS
jgi:hypothetical protein